MNLFAQRTIVTAGSLEEKLQHFLASNHESESLDDAKLATVAGDDRRADFFLGNRRLVAELKTVNADPTTPIERRLKERFQQPGAPLVFGRLGVNRVLKEMPDEAELNKMMVDVAARAVRRHIKKGGEQITATKNLYDVPDAGGLLIIANEASPLADLGAIGFAVKSIWDNSPELLNGIDHVWAVVEAHRIRLSDGSLGYPSLLISKVPRPKEEYQFFESMLTAWSLANGSPPITIELTGDWEVMRAVYDQPPTLSLF